MTSALAVAAAVSLLSAAPSTDEAEIRRLHEEERQAFLRADTASLERHFADSFVVTNPFGEFLTGADVIARVKEGRIAFQSFERTIEYVRVYGDAAVAVGRETGVWGGRMPVAGRPFSLRITTVWSKKDGRWLEVARHASVPPPPPSAPPPR